MQSYKNSKYCTKIENIILKNCVSSYTIDINKSTKTITKFRRKGVTVHGVYSDRLRRKYGFNERNCKKM